MRCHQSRLPPLIIRRINDVQNVTIREAEPLAWQAAVPSSIIIKQGPETHRERWSHHPNPKCQEPGTLERKAEEGQPKESAWTQKPQSRPEGILQETVSFLQSWCYRYVPLLKETSHFPKKGNKRKSFMSPNACKLLSRYKVEIRSRTLKSPPPHPHPRETS